MKNHKKITKAVIAVAGYGTRFLPATKNQPKEMLPIIDKPIIHYLVDEAVNSGITDIILVTRHGQHIMEDYFDNYSELENYLAKNHKEATLKIVEEIPQMANFIYVRQKKHLPYGNAVPLISVQNLIDDDEAFVYMYGDDLTLSAGTPVTKQLIDVFQQQNPAVVFAVQEVSDAVIHKYGVVKYKTNAPYKYEIDACLEKMPLGQNPSNMAIVGRFVFSYDVIKQALETNPGLGGELWLTDVVNALADKGNKVIAQPFEGEWLTTGDPLNYLKATFKFAMKRDDLAKDLTEFIKELI